eukprot:8538487-Alexandrium_andersonii.AAC.1
MGRRCSRQEKMRRAAREGPILSPLYERSAQKGVPRQIQNLAARASSGASRKQKVDRQWLAGKALAWLMHVWNVKPRDIDAVELCSGHG